MSIHQNFTPPYNPSTNVAFERANASILTVLQKIATANYQNWGLYLPGALFAYRLSVHQITQQSPFFILYGREAMTPLLMFPELLIQDETINSKKHVQQLEDVIVRL